MRDGIMKSYLLDLLQKDERTAAKIQREHKGDLILVEQGLEHNLTRLVCI